MVACQDRGTVHMVELLDDWGCNTYLMLFLQEAAPSITPRPIPTR